MCSVSVPELDSTAEPRDAIWLTRAGAVGIRCGKRGHYWVGKDLTSGCLARLGAGTKTPHASPVGPMPVGESVKVPTCPRSPPRMFDCPDDDAADLGIARCRAR